jgi:hypothetical protein
MNDTWATHVNILWSVFAFTGIHILSRLLSPKLFSYYFQPDQYVSRFASATYFRKNKKNKKKLDTKESSSHSLQEVDSETSVSNLMTKPKKKEQVIPSYHIHVQNVDWDVHVVAFAHAVISSLFGIWCYVMLLRQQSPFENFIDNPFFETNWYTDLLFQISIGYFVYDFIISTIYISVYGKSFFLHASLSLLAAMAIYLSGVGHSFAILFLLYEISTPFMNMRWFLANLDMKHTLAYSINGLLFMITFFLIRVVFGWVHFLRTSYQLYYLTDPRAAIIKPIFYLTASVLNGLNLFWFFQIFY